MPHPLSTFTLYLTSHCIYLVRNINSLLRSARHTDRPKQRLSTTARREDRMVMDNVSLARFNPYGTDMNSDNSRYSTLKQACKFGDLSSVRSILQSANSPGLDLHQPEPLAQRHLQMCLFEAFANNHFDTARYLIREAGAKMKPVEVLLVVHASKNFMPVEAFEFLIQEGWDINSSVREHRTALSYVLRSFPLTKWFLEHGANPNLGPDSRYKYTSEPCIGQNSGVVLTLAAGTDPSTAVALIDLLIQYSARLEDSIPLHYLAGCPPYQHSGQEINLTSTTLTSRIPILQHLLDLGCDPNASDKKYKGSRSLGPPLHWAVNSGLVENARFLLENGADPWAKNLYGWNALEVARRQNETDNPSGRDFFVRKYLREALQENELLGRPGDPYPKVEERLKALDAAGEIENEPIQESKLEQLIKKFM